MYGLELELSEKLASTLAVTDCGDDSGEPLESEERSDEAEWMEMRSSSDMRLGQNR